MTLDEIDDKLSLLHLFGGCYKYSINVHHMENNQALTPFGKLIYSDLHMPGVPYLCQSTGR